MTWTDWKSRTEVKQLNLYIYIKTKTKTKTNASSINPFFDEIDLSTTTGIKTFNSAIISLYDKEKYDGIQYSITQHLRAGKDQGAQYGWLKNVSLIETTPGVHLSVNDYPCLIKK